MKKADHLIKPLVFGLTRHRKNKQSITAAFRLFNESENGFDNLKIDKGFIYRINKNLYILPAIPELYWLELSSFDREKSKIFHNFFIGND